jgi:hypothetical protein
MLEQAMEIKRTIPRVNGARVPYYLEWLDKWNNFYMKTDNLRSQFVTHFTSTSRELTEIECNVIFNIWYKSNRKPGTIS